MSKRRVLKGGVSLFFIAAILGGTSSTANAGQPVVQACVGTTFSDGAAALPGGDLGHFIAGFARGGGLGSGIQTLQAGALPDEVVVNACN